MSARLHLQRLLKDCRGVTVVEFALAAPVLMLLVMGVLQLGIAMQNYNALRDLSADVARYALVEHQTGNVLAPSQLRIYAIARATGAPYLLNAQRVDALVTVPEQRVPGVRELQLTVSYQVESFMDFAGIEMPFLTYTRPIFASETS